MTDIQKYRKMVGILSRPLRYIDDIKLMRIKPLQDYKQRICDRGNRLAKIYAFQKKIEKLYDVRKDQDRTWEQLERCQREYARVKDQLLSIRKILERGIRNIQ